MSSLLGNHPSSLDLEQQLVDDQFAELAGGHSAIQRVYKCKFEDCGKIFPDQSSYRKHQMTHGERMFICPVPGCNKKFLDNSKLKRHQLVHTGEKPYECDICGKKFSLDFNLRTHLRTHTGEKPYHCTAKGCNKSFATQGHLNDHFFKCHSRQSDDLAAKQTQSNLVQGALSVNANQTSSGVESVAALPAMQISLLKLQNEINPQISGATSIY